MIRMLGLGRYTNPSISLRAVVALRSLGAASVTANAAPPSARRLTMGTVSWPSMRMRWSS